MSLDMSASPRTLGRMRVLAPAKINLHLRVAPVGQDGFHRLASWMCTVALFDTLKLENRDETGVGLTSDDSRLPGDASNLVVRAALALADPARGASISLSKRIPIGGGLGGGSSDAARTLLALNRLWKLDRSIEQLAMIASGLGSDVTFFLHGPCNFCTGRGEVVEPAARPRAQWALLILPVGISLATAEVYARFDEMRLGDERALRDCDEWRSWSHLSTDQLLPRLANDLEAPAFAIAPPLGQMRRDAEALLSRPVRMSGSGSSLFTLFDARDGAQDAARRIEMKLNARALTVEVAPRIVDDLS